MPTDGRSDPEAPARHDAASAEASAGAAVGPHGEPLRPLDAATLAASPFPYLRWAKAYLSWEGLADGAHCLGMSGVEPLATGERAALGMSPLPEVGAAHAGLKAALAERYGVGPAQIHLAAGTSHANFITYLALARGGRVAVEAPAYEALHRVADAASASLATFRRNPDQGWALDGASLDAAIDDRTDLIVATDLHNPSGLRLEDADLQRLIEKAERHDAYVLIDEVYADFDPVERPSAVHRSPRVVVTNSLTKVHGLPDLRAGWVLGSEDVIARIESWDDLVHPSLPPAPMVDAAAYIPQARERLAPLRAQAAERAAQVDAWVEATPRVRWTRPHGGLTGLLLLDGLDGQAVSDKAWNEHGVRVVPGSFFQVDEALRISYMLPEADLAQALDGLAAAMDACA